MKPLCLFVIHIFNKIKMQDRKMADKLGGLPAIQEHPLIQYHYLNDIAGSRVLFSVKI